MDPSTDLGAAISVRGFDDQTIQSWSRGAEALYGYAPSEAVGRIAHELLGSIYPLPLDEIEEVLRTKGEWLGAVRERRRDGTQIVVLASWRLGHFGSGRTRSIAQVALPLALERAAGAAREVALERAAGAAREVVLDATVARLVRKGVVQTAELAERNATVARLELAGGFQTAELVERDATVARLELEGEGQTADLVERDATVARLELREVGQTAELEEMDAFSYSVSHDLRTPLRAINGYAHALRDDHAAILPPDALSDLDRIQRAATRMGTLIDDLLRLSRISRTNPDRRRIDLAQVAREVAGRTSHASDTNRSVTWEIDDHAWASADQGLLEIAIENLLGNAWKFTAKGGAAVISFSSQATAEGLTFTVRDNGIGFDMSYVRSLFMPFQRLHSAREFAGTGIGLAIVERIVRRHGGRVWAEGELGRGTAVHFTLPEQAEAAS